MVLRSDAGLCAHSFLLTIMRNSTWTLVNNNNNNNKRRELSGGREGWLEKICSPDRHSAQRVRSFSLKVPPPHRYHETGEAGAGCILKPHQEPMWMQLEIWNDVNSGT